MELVILFLATAAIFLVLDAVMLKAVLFPLFSEHLGPILLEDPRMRIAVLFYLLYVLGLMWFVSIPALREDLPMQALLNGAIFGLIAYGTYEITNYATLRPWNATMVMVDLSWGTLLTAISAWGGVMITRLF